MSTRAALELGTLGHASSTPRPSPGSVPPSAPLLPFLAEPGFPLLAVHSQVTWRLQASWGAWAS